MKEIQIVKVPLKIDNLIISKVENLECRPFLVCKNNTGAENKDLRVYV
jgi:hypothetical protein